MGSLLNQVVIREASSSDAPALVELYHQAFGDQEGALIADLVTDLRQDHSANPSWSLVAEQNGHVLGHVLFTHAQVQTKDAIGFVQAQLLAPLAVLPESQNQGIGSQLVQTGLTQLQAANIPLVFVLGDPTYYGRFGFHAAMALSLMPPYPLAEQAIPGWMVNALLSDPVEKKARGQLRCATAWQRPELWG